jgi:hypothetical protein
MNAKQLVIKFGKNLIGQRIETDPIGNYPGGVSEVIAITPDLSAPEIALQVLHPTFGEIGVFEHESVSLRPNAELCHRDGPVDARKTQQR